MSSTSQSSEPTYDIGEEVARLKRILGLDVNRLAIGNEIEGIIPEPLFGSDDYTIKGINVIEFVNVSTSIVIGTQTGT